MSKVTMQDIANELGVTKVTVSKALSDKEGVSEQLRKTIKDLAKSRGYLYNAQAKALRTNRKGVIGIVCNEVFLENDEDFYTGLYKNLYTTLAENDFLSILDVVSKDNVKNNKYPKVCEYQMVDGLILLGQLDENYVSDILNLGVPMIMVDFYIRGLEVDCVITDNLYAMYDATCYLIEQGHREIGFVGNRSLTSSIQDRFLGYCKALFENGINQNPEYILEERDSNGEQKLVELPKELPTAFVCNSDQAAKTLVEALGEKGISVPGDISVMGFDDVVHSLLCTPQLTTVKVNRKEMAKYTVERLLEVMDKSETYVPRRIVVPTEIVKRNSVMELAKFVDIQQMN